MGNAQSTYSELEALTEAFRARLPPATSVSTRNGTQGGVGALKQPPVSDAAGLQQPTFSSKVDYVDMSMQSLLPPMAAGGFSSAASSGADGSQQGPRVTCLMTTTHVAASAARRAAIERSAQILRRSSHVGLFRCVVVNDNAAKQLAMIGAPQVDWLVLPAAAPSGGPQDRRSSTSGAQLQDTLDRWSVSEVLFGVASIVDAVSALTTTHNAVLSSLQLHQVSVAMHKGVSPSASIGSGHHHGDPNSAAMQQHSSEWLDASYVHAGRWILHDLSTLVEPASTSAGTAASEHDIGMTLRAVALFVLEVLGRIMKRPEMRSELLAVLRRSASAAASTSGEPRSPHGVGQSDGTSEYGSPGGRQPSCGGVGQSDDDTAAAGNDSFPRQPPAAGSALVTQRTVDSLFALLTEDMRLFLERSAPATAQDVDAAVAAAVDAAVSEGPVHAQPDASCSSSSASNSSPPSRSSATPVHQQAVPRFDAQRFACAAEGIVHWLHFCIFDAVHVVHDAGDVSRLLNELRDAIFFQLKDPICVLLRHGQQLYMYEAEDEHRKYLNDPAQHAPEGGSRAASCTTNLKLDAYEDMRQAAMVVQREFMSGLLVMSPGAPPACDGSSEGEVMSVPAADQDPSLGTRCKAVITTWERRILRWLLHTSHVSQFESHKLMDFIFSTIGAPTALISPTQLTHVAVAWLTDTRNPMCRAAALRYAPFLMHALPRQRLGGVLTTCGFVLMQVRRCLKGIAATVAHRNRILATSEAKGSTAGGPSTASVGGVSFSATAVLVALQCARAYVEAIPVIIQELLGTRGDAVDKASSRWILQHVVLKELALVFRACVHIGEEGEDNFALYGGGGGNASSSAAQWNGMQQAVVKLLRQTLLTLADVALPCLARLATDAGHAKDLLPSAIAFLSCCGYGVYYGSVESRERTLSILSALLPDQQHAAHPPAATSSGHPQTVRHTGGRAPLPTSPSLISRWWLPMLTPLCGTRNQNLRTAASRLALQLTPLLLSPPAASTSSPSGNSDGGDVPTFHTIFAANEAELQQSHGIAMMYHTSDTGVASVEAIQAEFIAQYHKTVYLPCFVEACAARSAVSASPAVTSNGANTGGAAATPIGTSAVPTKDFLTSMEGRRAMWWCLHGRTDHDDVLLPQPFL